MTMSQETPTPAIVAPQVLLGNHLKALKLPTFAREYEKVVMESAQDRADYPRFLLRLCELERIDRERRNVERRIRLARFPQTKSFDTFDFAAQPSLNKALVLELTRCEWIDKRENCIALGPSETGKTHVALGLGLAACQKGYSVAFTTAAALVHELMEARDERRLRALQKHLNTVKLLIVDELGYVPFTAVGSELLFEVFSQRYEHGATLVTSNLPFDEWTSIFGSERLTGALARSAYPSRPHSGNEWRKLPARHQQEGAAAISSGAKPKSENTKRRRAYHQKINPRRSTKINQGLKALFTEPAVRCVLMAAQKCTSPVRPS